MLIDIGASHNFVSNTCVKSLQLLVLTTPNYLVTIGIEEHVKSLGVCQGLTLDLSNFVT